MNNTPDKSKDNDSREKPSAEGDAKKRKADPQLSELDGLKKGGVEPTVHQSDKARDNHGRIDE